MQRWVGLVVIGAIDTPCRASLTKLAGQNIDAWKHAPDGRHQIGTPAGFRSESMAGLLSECMPGFVGIRIAMLRSSPSPSGRAARRTFLAPTSDTSSRKDRASECLLFKERVPFVAGAAAFLRSGDDPDFESDRIARRHKTIPGPRS